MNRAASGGIDAEAAGVGKQIEEALARRAFLNHAAGDAMVTKQTGIDVGVEVDQKS